MINPEQPTGGSIVAVHDWCEVLSSMTDAEFYRTSIPSKQCSKPCVSFYIGCCTPQLYFRNLMTNHHVNNEAERNEMVKWNGLKWNKGITWASLYRTLRRYLLLLHHELTTWMMKLLTSFNQQKSTSSGCQARHHASKTSFHKGLLRGEWWLSTICIHLLILVWRALRGSS